MTENINETLTETVQGGTQDYIDDWNDNRIEESSKSLSDAFSTLSSHPSLVKEVEENEDLLNDLQDIKNNLQENRISLGKALKLTYLYFDRIVKQGDHEMVFKYLEEREDIIWSNFSHNEQEKIRKTLKALGHGHIYTTDFVLKNALYICEECANWMDDLEAQSQLLEITPRAENPTSS